MIEKFSMNKYYSEQRHKIFTSTFHTQILDKFTEVTIS